MATFKFNISAKCQMEFQATTPQEFVKIVSAFSEVLTETKCGECGSTDIRLEHRNRDGFDFYNWRCTCCRAELSFGQFKDGSGLFAKRDKAKNGWYRYQKENNV